MTYSAPAAVSAGRHITKLNSGAPPERILAGEITQLTFDTIAPSALAVAAQCVLDALGVAIAGASSPASRIAREVVLSESASGPATLIGQNARTGAQGAALVNGTTIHALDFDDLLPPMDGHPTAPVLPAALAVAEELGVGGRQLLVALVAGIETAARVGTALGRAHSLRGFHATGTAGTLGAAAAVASLLRLPVDRAQVALGIAATSASGLKANFGTMSKPLHAGNAAAAGVLAAKLSSAGLTASERGLSERRGMLAVLSESPEPDALAQPFGRPWHIESTLFKFHSACFLTHATIDAALALRADGLATADIESVEVVVPPGHLDVCAIPEPQTGSEGKFSLRFTTALALHSGTLDESRFTDATVRDPELVALRDLVHVTTADDIELFGGLINVRTRDGRVLHAEADSRRPREPRSAEQQLIALDRKFNGLVEPILGATATQRLHRMLTNLPDLDSVSALLRATVPTTSPQST